MEKIRTSYYFPHDIGACNDPKLIDIRIRFGWKGIGMFWAIIEALHKEDKGELPSGIVSSMITDFYRQEEIRESRHVKEEAAYFEETLYTNVLLTKYDGITTSARVKENIQEREEKSNKARESVAKRWNKNKVGEPDNTNVIRTQYERNTIKERKTNENKEKENTKQVYGKLGNVKLSEKEHLELRTKFGADFEDRVENLSLYIASKGDKYKSHYATLLSWERKNGNSPGVQKYSSVRGITITN